MIEILSFLKISIFNPENIFLLSIAVLWCVIAVIQDFRKREVANWWNFSLIVFALAFRAFISVSKLDYRYFLWGIIGLIIGFLLAELFYYSRLFAQGDAKLLLALSVILPLSFDWKTNLWIFLIFLVLIIIAGGLYGLVYSLILGILHFKDLKKEYLKYFKKFGLKGKIMILMGGIFSLACYILGYYDLIVFGIILFIYPFLFSLAKSIEERALTKLVNLRDLTIGDWLAKPVKIGNKIIKPNWEGLDEKELNLILKKSKNKKILVKYGIPFTPAFLLALIGLIIVLI